MTGKVLKQLPHRVFNVSRPGTSKYHTLDQGRIKGLLGLGLKNFMGLCLSDNNKQQNRLNILAAKIFLKHKSVTLRAFRLAKSLIVDCKPISRNSSFSIHRTASVFNRFWPIVDRNSFFVLCDVGKELSHYS